MPLHRIADNAVYAVNIQAEIAALSAILHTIPKMLKKSTALSAILHTKLSSQHYHYQNSA